MSPDDVLHSLVAAMRKGTLLGWSIEHVVPGRDVVAEAWAVSRDAITMRSLLGEMCRWSLVWCDPCDIGSSPSRNCPACCRLIRSVMPTLTMDDVLRLKQHV